MVLYEGGRAYNDSDVISGTAAAAISAGDALALSGSGYAPAGDTDNVVGVARTDAASGDVVSVNTQGVCVANVASGVASGAAVDSSTTAGQLASGAGPFVTLSAEGGEYENQSVPAGYAVALLQ